MFIETDASFAKAEDGTIRAGVAAVLVEDKPLLAVGKDIACNDNIEAELNAVLFGLEEIPVDGTKVVLYNDNQDVIGFIRRDNFCPERYRPLVTKIKLREKTKNLDVEYVWRDRSNQATADAIATLAARKGQRIYCRT